MPCATTEPRLSFRQPSGVRLRFLRRAAAIASGLPGWANTRTLPVPAAASSFPRSVGELGCLSLDEGSAFFLATCNVTGSCRPALAACFGRGIAGGFSAR